jgi:hypothetical protein
MTDTKKKNFLEAKLRLIKAKGYILLNVPGSCNETRPVLSHDGNEVVIIKFEEDIDIKEQEIPVAVVLPPVKAEHDYHSSMPHTPTINITPSQHTTTLTTEHHSLSSQLSLDLYC